MQPDSSDSEVELPAIFLALSALPQLGHGDFVDTIAQLEPLGAEPRVVAGGGLDALADALGGDALWLPALPTFIEFEDHRIELLGFEIPLQEATGEGVLERTVGTSYLTEDLKRAILAHRAHAVLWYRGDAQDPIEQHIALFKVARCFCPHLLGVLNEPAWGAVPAPMVEGMFRPEVLQACRSSMPPITWTGMIKMPRPDGKCWYVTKGHHLFGVADFAFMGDDMEQTQQAIDTFTNLLEHAYRSQTEFKVGDVAQIGEEYLRFGRLPEDDEYYEFLMGPRGTLLADRIPAHIYHRKQAKISGRHAQAALAQTVKQVERPEPKPEPRPRERGRPTAAVRTTMGERPLPPPDAESQSGSTSLYLLVKHKRLLPAAQLDGARRASTAEGAPLRSYLEGLLDQQVLIKLLRKRERHGRVCRGCRRTTYLLPKQTVDNTQCEHCGGRLIRQ